jgi:TonB family protein
MQRAWPVTIAFSLLPIVAEVPLTALAAAPVGDLPEARPAPLYNPASRCPRVRMADEGTIAVVVFVVGSSGVPSQPSIRKSSQSKDLDAAALECVMKLRYSPTVRAGDGVAVDAWHQLGWRWTQTPQAEGAATPPTSASASSAPAAAAATSSAPTAVAAGAAAGGAALAGGAMAASGRTAAPTSSGGASAAVTAVELRVCADDAGRLTQDPTIVHSSGNAGLDQAAVRIAKSGSGNYRPASTLNGKPASGCAQLSIRFE